MGAPPPLGAAPAAPHDLYSRSGSGAASHTKAEPTGASADEEDPVEEDAEAKAMREMMGFSAFDSTAGKSVDDPRCKMEAVKKKATRKYRQYMNRKGGFNRPLENV